MREREQAAELLAEMGDTEESLRVYREILGFYPNHIKSYWLRIDMARTLIAMSQVQLAVWMGFQTIYLIGIDCYMGHTIDGLPNPGPLEQRI